MTTITPGSAFSPDYQPQLDLSDVAHSQRLSRKASAVRDQQIARGNTGTFFGLSKLSDEQIAKSGRVRKPSAM